MIDYNLTMTTTEVKPITVLVVDLQDEEGVANAVVTHTPPDDSTPLTITPTIETPYVNMRFGPFVVPGIHFVKVQAVGNAANPSKPEVVYAITVKDF